MKKNMAAGFSIASAILFLVAGCGRQDSAPSPATPQGAASRDASAMEDSSPAVQAATPERLQLDPDGVAAGGNCSLDSINGQQVTAASLRVGDQAAFAGWVGDGQGQVPDAAQLVLSRDGVVYGVPLQMEVERPDVAQALTSPGLARSGFGLSTALSVEPGVYALSVLIGSPPVARCMFDVQLTVSAP